MNTSGDPRRQQTAQKQKQRPPAPGWRRYSWLIVGALVLLFDIFFYGSGLMNKSKGAQVPTTYSYFIKQVDAGNITTAKIAGNIVQGDFKTPYKDPKTKKIYPRYSTTVVSEVLQRTVARLERHKIQISLSNTSLPLWATLLGYLLQGLPLLFLLALFAFAARAQGSQAKNVLGFGRSNAKLYNEERPTTTFKDVAGVDAAKGELLEIVDFLKDPSKYHSLGARIPKGVLLVGPPGTGKTLMARAIAGEAHVPFYSISSTEFVELFVGVGASRVRDLFTQARENSPCIVFVDEIDAIGGQRSSRTGLSGGNDEREQTLNQLLVSMDGFEPNEAVIVLAATNRADVLDQALLRPGRFDREVVLDLPDRAGREAILRIHTRNIPLAADVDLSSLAQATPGMSGADLANLANEAALVAARAGATQVASVHFDGALDRITLGSEGSPLMNADERRTVAYHEGGHALVAFMLPNVDPVHRVTITPRGRSLGVTQFRPIDDRRNYARNYLINRMAVGLGGRSAEEIACDDITSGAQNDIQQVTAMARSVVTQLGMADQLGPIYFGGPNDNGNPYAGLGGKEYSDETAERIDEAVSQLVNEAHARARSVLSANRSTLEAIADALERDESLTREQLTDIVNAHRSPQAAPIPVPTGEPTPIAESPA